jgi:hypothetical protein
MSYDPRTISQPVYQALVALRQDTQKEETLKEQKNQAVELYHYLATWGLLRLKAEQELGKLGHQQMVRTFFTTLASLANQPELSTEQGLEHLLGLEASHYLGLTGLALQLTKEYSFWAMSVYADIKGDHDDG